MQTTQTTVQEVHHVVPTHTVTSVELTESYFTIEEGFDPIEAIIEAMQDIDTKINYLEQN